jgi:hypothetical protein
MLGSIRVSQLIGLVFFLVFTAILLLIYLKDRKEKKEARDNEEMATGTSEYASILKENIKLSDDEESEADKEETEER